jgi:hypothetical protein
VLLGDDQEMRSTQAFIIWHCLNSPSVKTERCGRVPLSRELNKLGNYSFAGPNSVFAIFRIFFLGMLGQVDGA